MDTASPSSASTSNIHLLREMSAAKLDYISNLRFLLVVLVVLQHLIGGYGGGSGRWYYNNSENVTGYTWTLLTSLWLINQAFFMGVFFLLSSYFLLPSLARKGSARFLGDRFKRLVGPLVFYLLLVNPAMQYLAWRQKAGFTGSFGSFLPLYLRDYHSLDVGVLWFVWLLLLFTALTVLVNALLGGKEALLGRWVNLPYFTSCIFHVPSNRNLFFFALAMGLLTCFDRLVLYRNPPLELLGIPRGHIVQYAAMFAAGLLASRGNWLGGITKMHAYFWLALAAILIPLVPLFVISSSHYGLPLIPYSPEAGWNWMAIFAYALLENLLCVAMAVTCLYFGRRFLNLQSRWFSPFQNSSYAMYVVHAPVVTLVILLLSPLTLSPVLKFVLALVFALMVTTILALAVRRTRVGAWML